MILKKNQGGIFMRRENRRSSEDNGLDTKKILYIAGSILSVAIIGFVVTFFVYGKGLKKADTNLGKLDTNMTTEYMQNTEEASSSLGKTVNEMTNTLANEVLGNSSNNTANETNTTKYAVNTSNVEEKTTTQNTKKDKESTDKSKIAKNETNKKEEAKTETKVSDPTFKRPVVGEVIREFAKDKLVYSNTLAEWVTHNGVDIKADKTTVVKVAADGTVKSIKNDPRYGLTVVVEHTNGFSTVYSNLLTAEFVVEGENIKQGQTVGTIGNTASFEISDEAHLHFEITKDGEYLDPELYIKE